MFSTISIYRPGTAERNSALITFDRRIWSLQTEGCPHSHGGHGFPFPRFSALAPLRRGRRYEDGRRRRPDDSVPIGPIGPARSRSLSPGRGGFRWATRIWPRQQRTRRTEKRSRLQRSVFLREDLEKWRGGIHRPFFDDRGLLVEGSSSEKEPQSYVRLFQFALGSAGGISEKISSLRRERKGVP